MSKNICSSSHYFPADDSHEISSLKFHGNIDISQDTNVFGLYWCKGSNLHKHNQILATQFSKCASIIFYVKRYFSPRNTHKHKPHLKKTCFLCVHQRTLISTFVACFTESMRYSPFIMHRMDCVIKGQF